MSRLNKAIREQIIANGVKKANFHIVLRDSGEYEVMKNIGSTFVLSAHGAKHLGDKSLQCETVRVEQYGPDYVVVRDDYAKPHCAIFEAAYTLDEMVKRLSD